MLGRTAHSVTCNEQGFKEAADSVDRILRVRP
jgi:hypothetical protein